MDLDHLLQRITDPFNPESRFYWPAVIAVGVAVVAHTAWFLWRPTKPRHPVRDFVESLVYWSDMIALVLVLVAIAAKVRFWQILVLLGAEWAVVAYLYFVYAPPRAAEWEREERKRRYIPEPKRRSARR